MIFKKIEEDLWILQPLNNSQLQFFLSILTLTFVHISKGYNITIWLRSMVYECVSICKLIHRKPIFHSKFIIIIDSVKYLKEVYMNTNYHLIRSLVTYLSTTLCNNSLWSNNHILKKWKDHNAWWRHNKLLFLSKFLFNKSRFELYFIWDMHFLAQLLFYLKENKQDLLQKS